MNWIPLTDQNQLETIKDLSGNEFDFATLKGKKILIVNTASECGLTPQYEQLQAIYEKYKDLVDMVIDGGYGDNTASTIIDLSGHEPIVIREGKGDINIL